MAKANILIIDDDPDITEAMKVVLENDDYAVDNASDSKEAMTKIESSPPDLIILDVMMNSMQEGFVFSRKLKNNAAYREIPILMLTAVKEKTGFDFKDAAGDETWLPVEEFIDKPVKPNVLLSKVAEMLKS